MISIHDHDDALAVLTQQRRRRHESREHWRQYLASPVAAVEGRHPMVEAAWERRVLAEDRARELAVVREGG